MRNLPANPNDLTNWRCNPRVLSSLAAILTLAQPLQARAAVDSEPPPAPPPFKLLRYDENYSYLRDPARRSDYLDAIKFIPLTTNGDWYLTLGGEIRERYEYFHNSSWGRGPQDDNGYLLQRYMVHADAHLGDYLRVFTQFKSSLEDGRNGGPRPTDRDDFDLSQAFLDMRFPLSEAGSLTLRAGRQELAYGSYRLVSSREGPNVHLNFDGVKAILQIARWRVDAFVAKPDRTKTGIFDDDPDPNQKFLGLYAVTPVSWLPGGNIDLYYLGLDRRNAHFDQGTAHEQRHSVGTRIWGRKLGWDYNLEFVYQFGTFASGDIRAWTAASDVGYTFETAPFKPRLALKANVTSGDDNPNNSGLQTFNPLFPLTRNVKLTIDWDFFWRENTHDAIYGPAVNVLQSGKTNDARYVGNQAQVMVEWKIDRHITLTADYAHFFAGDFLKQTTPGEDVDYFSAWITFRF